MLTDHPYNPLDKLNLGRSVAEALLLEPVRQLGDVGGLVGAGVYALYYTGTFPAYERIANLNRSGLFKQPIYVGKAVPKGARKGGLSFDAATGNAMRTRLRRHAGSIAEAQNLEISDFYCRALMVDDVWIPLGENMMIEQFRPIWNLVIDGFGNQPPGSGRNLQRISQWDILHSGRAAFAKLAKGETTVEHVKERLNAFFEGRPVALLKPEQAVDPGGEDE